MVRRQREKIIQFRVSNAELSEIQAKAERRGLATGSFAREAILGAKALRAVRRPSIDRQVVASALAALGPIAGELRQIGKVGEPEEKLDKALGALTDMRDLLMKSIGRDI